MINIKRTIALIDCVLLALRASSAYATPKASDSKAIVIKAGKITSIIGSGETAMFESLVFEKR
jgi:hypothetical protein